MNKNKTNVFGLKGYAALLVFISHCNFGINSVGMGYTEWLGSLSVEIFIMISGYLLMEHHSSSGIELGPYIKSKFIKLYPLYALMLLVSVPLVIITKSNPGIKGVLSFISNALMIQAFIPDELFYFGFNSTGWYISLVFFFFIVSPLIIKFWNKIDNVRNILLIFLGIIVLEYAMAIIFQSYQHSEWLLYVFPPVRTLDFALGAGMWKLRQVTHKEPADEEADTVSKSNNLKSFCENYIFLPGILIAAVLCAVSLNIDSELFSVALWSIPSLMLITVIDNNTPVSKKIFSNKAASFMGKISSVFFLIHYPCISYLDLLFERLNVHSIPVIVITELAISILLTLLYQHIDKKIRSMRKNNARPLQS